VSAVQFCPWPPCNSVTHDNRQQSHYGAVPIWCPNQSARYPLSTQSGSPTSENVRATCHVNIRRRGCGRSVKLVAVVFAVGTVIDVAVPRQQHLHCDRHRRSRPTPPSSSREGVRAREIQCQERDRPHGVPQRRRVMLAGRLLSIAARRMKIPTLATTLLMGMTQERVQTDCASHHHETSD
jgi:hypothetical protein